MRALILLGVTLIALFVGVNQVLFTVDQTQSVVITRFGEIIEVYTTPGLKVRVPFIDTVNRLDNRVLRIDVPPTSMPDVDNQFLEVDAYVRYEITDPRKFIQTLRNEVSAASTIGQIVIAALRNEVGLSTQEEIIGGRLLEIQQDRTVVEELLTADGVPTRLAIVTAARLSANTAVNAPENDFGIRIVDVRIKRADFPETTEENIFSRMRSERQVQADRLRAEGEQDFRTRTADVDRRVEIIAADADKQSNELRGEGEGEAIRILAEALEQDPDLFAFRRSLEAYKVFLGSQTTVILSADSDLFKFLQQPGFVE
ncbi:MAG: protease modulator HflC [Chloroflexi bacterium]|nr:protease modulator HflC [Chloroflexota bacterium]MCI0778905.1 protease modulator HflC [Chloroflexota bacterium]MCI0816205.1 protease modulator HflC [Chloroflexota bacterium]MCI0821033.1 protease modulator HflC [Chloroflexota bacterium]MCI0888244.1 protease modulator HflC [Chloroflexota bacterium]